MNRSRILLTAVAVVLVVYLGWSRFLVPGQRVGAQRMAVAYEECGMMYGLPMANGRSVPAAELGTKDRNLLLQCAIEVGSPTLVHLALAGTKDRLGIPPSWRVGGLGAVEQVARWADGKAAVEVLKLLLEPNDALWRIDRSAPIIAAAYEAGTVEAAAYLAGGYPFVLKEDNALYFDSADYPRYYGLTPAQYHAFSGRLAVAEYFAGQGVKVATSRPFRHLLLQKDKGRLLDDKLDAFLAAHGVPRNERDEKGQTLVHAAVLLGEEQIIATALARGADPDLADRNGNAPLHDAARTNQPPLLNALLVRANPDARDHQGRTPLHVAFGGAAWAAAAALLDRKAALDIRDNLGRTPLLECVSHGCPLLDRLMAAGADLDVADNARNTPLHEAARFDGGGDLAQKLIARGVAVDRKNLEGRTALHLAAEGDNPALVQLLLDNGAAVNEKDNLGNTALHLARSAPVAVALLDGGGNPDLANKAGVRPVNGEVERSRMLFHSPALIRGRNDTLPRHFSAILALEEPARRVELVSPTTGLINAVTGEAGDTVGTPPIEFIPRSPALEISVQQACEAGAFLVQGDDTLELPRLPVRSDWQDVAPPADQPRTFRAVIKPAACNLPAVTPEQILAVLKSRHPGAGERWLAVARTCPQRIGNADSPCRLFVRPVLRVLVKAGKDWKEAGILHTSDGD